MHPEWAPRTHENYVKGYQAPSVPKPATDNLDDVLPLSRLCVSGKSRANGGVDGALAALQARESETSLPIELPADPFGAGDGEDAVHVGHGFVDIPRVSDNEGSGTYLGGEDYSSTYSSATGIKNGSVIADGVFGSSYTQGGSSSGGEGVQHVGSLGTSPSYNAWLVSTTEGEEDGWGDSENKFQYYSDRSQGIGSSLCIEYYHSGSCSKAGTCKMVHGNFCEVGGNMLLVYLVDLNEIKKKNWNADLRELCIESSG